MLPVINRMGGILQSILQLPTVHYNFKAAEKHSEFLKVVCSFRNIYQARAYVPAIGTGPGDSVERGAQGPASPTLHFGAGKDKQADKEAAV